MSFLDDISRFAGNLTGGAIGDSDEERKKRAAEAARLAAQKKANRTTYTPELINKDLFNSKRGAIEDGLTRGASFDQISKDTGLGIFDIADYSKNTRVNYADEVKKKIRPEDNVVLDTLGNRSTADLLEEYNKSDVYKQREIINNLDKEVNKARSGNDLSAARTEEQKSYVLQALNEKGEKKDGNLITTVQDIGKGMVDQFTDTGETLARGISVATGENRQAADNMNKLADTISTSAINLKKSGKITDEDFQAKIAEADQHRYLANRMLNRDVESSDPMKMAGAVATAGFLPVSFAAGLGTTGQAGKVGLGMVAEDVVKAELPTVLRSNATQILSRVAPQLTPKKLAIAGAALENVVSGAPQAFSQVLMEKGGDASIADYATAQIMNAVASAALPVGAAAVGATLRKIKTDVIDNITAKLGRELSDPERISLTNEVDQNLVAKAVQESSGKNKTPEQLSDEINQSLAQSGSEARVAPEDVQKLAELQGEVDPNTTMMNNVNVAKADEPYGVPNLRKSTPKDMIEDAQGNMVDPRTGEIIESPTGPGRSIYSEPPTESVQANVDDIKTRLEELRSGSNRTGADAVLKVNAESEQAIVTQELNTKIAAIPDRDYIDQMAQRFGLQVPTVARLLKMSNKADLFNKLNSNAEFIKSANVPDAAATSIVKKAIAAGKAAENNGGVALKETKKLSSMEQQDIPYTERTFYRGLQGKALEEFRNTGKLPNSEQAFGGDYSITDDYDLAKKYAGENGSVVAIKLDESTGVKEADAFDKNSLVDNYDDVQDIGEGEFVVNNSEVVAPVGEMHVPKAIKTNVLDNFEELRTKAFDDPEGVVDTPYEQNIIKQADKAGYEIFYDEDWGGHQIALKNTGQDMVSASAKMKDLAKRYGFDLEVNPDGTIRMYHGTDKTAKEAITKDGFEDGVIFLTPSKEVEYGGVNGAAYYGDHVVSVDVDPRKIVFNPSGEFSVDTLEGGKGGIVRVADEAPQVTKTELSPESQKLVDEADAALNTDNQSIIKDNEESIRRSNEKLLDPKTTADQATMLIRDILEKKAQNNKLKGVETAAPKTSTEAPTIKPLTLDGKKAAVEIMESLPKTKASPDEVAAAYEPLRKNLEQYYNGVVENLKAKGKTYEEYVTAIRDANRRYVAGDKTAAPDKVFAQIYGKYQDPLNKMYRGTAKTEFGEQKWYLPEMMKSDAEAPRVEVNGSIINSLDTSFGASMAREGKIEVGDLDTGINPQLRYFDQYYIDRYGVQMKANKSAEKANEIVDVKTVRKEAELGRPLSEAEAEAIRVEVQNSADGARSIGYFEKQEKIVTSLSDRVHKIANATSEDAAKIKGKKIIDEFEELGKEAGFDQNVIDFRLSMSRDALDASGAVLEEAGIYKSFGFDQYENAAAFGNDRFMENFDDAGMPQYKSDKELFDKLFTKHDWVPAADDSKKKLVWAAIKRINRVQETKELELHPTLIQYELTRLEKDMARETLSEALQHNKLTNPRFRHMVNYHAERMLTQDLLGKDLLKKISDGITGVVAKGALGLNINASVLNVTETKRLFAEIGAVEYAKAFKHGTANVMKILNRYGKEDTHFQNIEGFADYMAKGDEGLARSIITEIKSVGNWWGDIAMAGFKATEQWKDAIFLSGYESAGKKLGLEGSDLTDYVLERYRKMAIKQGQFGTNGLGRNPITKVLTQFSAYPIKEAKINLSKFQTLFDVQGKFSSKEHGDAAKYLVRLGIANSALYMGLAPTLGTGFNMIFSSSMPSYGPALDFLIDSYNAFQEQNTVATDKDGEKKTVKPSVADAALTAFKRDTALLVPGGNQLINKTGVQALLPKDNVIRNWFDKSGYLVDRSKGFNQAPTGKVRFAVDQDSPYEFLKGIMNGQYNQKNAKEYFGTTDPLSGVPIIGQYFKGEKGYPAWDSVQKDIDAAKTIKEKQKIFGDFKKLREQNAAIENAFLDDADPAVIADYYRLNGKTLRENKSSFEQLAEKVGLGEVAKQADALFNGPQQKYYSTIKKDDKGILSTEVGYNKDTGRKVSDLITPEKWTIQMNNPGVFKKEKADALLNNKRNDAPIDPVYQIADTAHLKDILAIRSANTGDLLEREEILKATAPWYNEFLTKQDAYYKENTKYFDKLGLNTDAQENKRVLEYREAGLPVTQPPLIASYFKIMDEQGKDAAKAWGKTQGDALSTAFDEYSKLRLDRINKMRAIEGVDPISQEVFDAASYGFDASDLTGGSGYGSSSKWTGVSDSISNFGGGASGGKIYHPTLGKLTDVTKVVKRPHASGKSKIRIKI